MLVQLPLELVVKILKFLSINDQIKLRKLNKKCRSIVDAFCRIENLVVQSCEARVYDFDDQEELIDCCSMQISAFVDINLVQKVFKQLKRLVMNEVLCWDDLLNFRKLDLTHVINLEFRELKLRNEQIELDLPELQYFKIKFITTDGDQQCLKINAPKLTNLNLHIAFSSEGIEFSHPESLSHLYMIYYLGSIYKFFNLKYLHFDCELSSFFINSSEFLNNFPKLEHLYLSDVQLTTNLILKREELRRYDLKLFFKYIELNSLDDLQSLDSLHYELFSLNTNLIYQLDMHLDKLADVILCHHLDFECLNNNYGIRKIPEKLIRKFKILNNLVVRRVKNLSSLTSLLRTCKKIKCLEICSLPQTFFDDLPNMCPKLEQLKFLRYNSDLKLNFLLKFKNLTRLWIRDQLFTVDYSKSPFKKVSEINDQTILMFDDFKFVYY